MISNIDLNMELYIIIGVAALAIVLVSILIRQRNQKNRLNKEYQYNKWLLEELKPFRGLENNLAKILELLSEVFTVRTYGFYILDEQKQRYRLKSVRFFSDHDGKVGPSYSGLVPYKKQDYQLPLSIETSEKTTINGKIIEGEVHLIQLVVSGQKALVRMGPITTVPKREMKKLPYFSRILRNPIDILLTAENYKTEKDVLELSEHAISYISKLSLDSYEFMNMVLETSKNAFGFSGGCLFLKKGAYYTVPYFSGTTKHQVNQVKEDYESRVFLENLLKSHQTLMIHSKSDGKYKSLPAQIQQLNKEAFVFSPHYIENGKGVLCFWKERESENKPQNHEGIRMMLPKIEMYLKLISQSTVVRKQNTEKLKMLAQMVDNLTPWTVGYSELMQRYAIIIAKGLKLSEQEVSQIGLAAYLSNIGVLGLSNHLLYKEGKYSDHEFEQMKLHTEVGASIIENMLSSSKVASYIRHHHERMDGNGYPNGISGDDIPIGARIIAVVQTFLAKINGRSYRDPLDFDKALTALKSASGHQLDERLVTILVDWFKEKRKPLIQSNESLGNCWDMLCVPSEVCAKCPVYGQQTKKCWETDRNNCLAHGKTCDTCYVYTESVGRKQVGLSKGKYEEVHRDN